MVRGPQRGPGGSGQTKGPVDVVAMATFMRMGESVVAVSLYRDPDERPEAIAELLRTIAAEFERPGQEGRQGLAAYLLR